MKLKDFQNGDIVNLTTTKGHRLYGEFVGWRNNAVEIRVFVFDYDIKDVELVSKNERKFE